MDKERRKAPGERRRAGRVPAVFAVKKSVGNKVHMCMAEDIGLAGITVKRATVESYRPRTPVAVAFELPGSHDEIAARGVITSDVSHGRYRRTGIRFLRVRSEHQQLIAAYCCRL